MDILKQNKTLFIGLAIVIALFIGYGMMGGSSAGSSNSIRREYTNAGSSPIEQETLTLLRDIESVQLNSAVLSDPAFAVLRDFSRSIINEPRGRDNPFAPIDLDSLASTTEQLE